MRNVIWGELWAMGCGNGRPESKAGWQWVWRGWHPHLLMPPDGRAICRCSAYSPADVIIKPSKAIKPQRSVGGWGSSKGCLVAAAMALLLTVWPIIRSHCMCLRLYRAAPNTGHLLRAHVSSSHLTVPGTMYQLPGELGLSCPSC